MREVSDTLWNFHLTWRSKNDEIMFPPRAQAPHRVVLYDNRASIGRRNRRVQRNKTSRRNAECRSPDPSAKELRARLEIRLKIHCSGAPPIAEPVLVQALGNGLRYESGFWEDIRIRPSPTLKDAFLRAENYIRLEQDIPQLRFDPEDPRFRLRNKRKSSSSRPEKSTHKAPRCHHESLPRRDDAPVYEARPGETWRIARRLIAMHPRNARSPIRRYSRSLPIFEELP
ncbi:unnamed protein product [Microthlaspi erraticum]|uniref:Uncharacterized protein n=1 Tax=Microthlaspi erraticum TaxID=1685480 RepID=A0A6D2I0C9_9BRAS|nr:unnamed protein product [Microthlaspi erraticum]